MSTPDTGGNYHGGHIFDRHYPFRRSVRPVSAGTTATHMNGNSYRFRRTHVGHEHRTLQIVLLTAALFVGLTSTVFNGLSLLALVLLGGAVHLGVRYDSQHTTA